MPGLDTNVIMRWLIDDDDAQTKLAARVFDAAKIDDEPLYVPGTVILELAWVLQSHYGHSDGELIRVLGALLETRELEIQNEGALEIALQRFALGTADFADCLHAALCRDADKLPILTFDRKASRLTEFQLLGNRS